MIANKIKFLIFVSHFFIKSQGLEKLDSKEDDIILATESVIRNTTNNLFSGLHFSKKVNPRIKQALLVHTFFISVTLRDHNTLNLIVKLSRVNKYRVNNDTEHCKDIINEILNEDWSGAGGDHLANNEGIIEYVNDFLSNLNGFKENSGYNNDYEKLDIKDEIIHILKSDNPSELNPSLKRNQTLTPKYKEDDAFISDNEFWAPQLTRRIYRGEKTKIKHFPFMASIQIFQNFQCAGSIIKSDLIITAASCLQLAWNNRFFRENPAFLSTRVGSNFYSGGGEDIPVLEVYFHPDYNPRNLKNNIAVLRLMRHLKFRKHKKRMKKIDIDREDSPLPLTTDGITIVGWGAKGTSNVVRDPWSNQLAFAVLEVYHLQECQEIYSRQYVTRTNFCAGFISKGGGACNHDVGGPGVVNGILTGIISFGSPVCGTPDAPTVFTKVGYYADWIEEIMEQDVPTIRKKTTLSFPPPPETTPAPFFAQTTFKILPLAKWKPVSIDEAGALRLLEDEDLFKEFLTTMFNSKEVNEYKDLLNYFPVKNSDDLDTASNQQTSKIKYGQFPKEDFGSMAGEILEKFTHDKVSKKQKENLMSKEMHEEFDTKDENRLHKLAIDKGNHAEGDTFESDSEKQKRFTVLNVKMTEPKVRNDGDIEKNIVDLIEKIDFSDTNEKSSSSGASEEGIQGDLRNRPEAIEKSTNEAGEELGMTRLDLNFVTERVTQQSAQKQDRNDVLTLLYVSKTEKSNNTLENIGHDIEDFDDNISEGLPIEAEAFKDLTFRNKLTKANKTSSILDFLSKNELYDLLSEAIDEVTKYKKN